MFTRFARVAQNVSVRRLYATAASTPAPPPVAATATRKTMTPLGKAVVAGLAVGVGAGIYSLGKPIPHDQLPLSAPNEPRAHSAGHNGPPGDATAPQKKSWSDNAYTRVMGVYKYFVDPTSTELLPDAYPPGHPMHRPMTLLVELDKLLVFSSWDKDNGWRVAKRPWADYFLSYLHNYYEIVLFTTQTPMYAAPIVDKLDGQMGAITYRLYRDSTRYDIESGQNVKDLSILNRPLDRVILLDPEEAHYAHTQPENALDAKAWQGEPNDTYLLDLIPFLETLAVSGVQDVRDVLRSYRGHDVPTLFAENMKRVQEMQMADYQRQHGVKNAGEAAARKSVQSGGSWLGWIGDGVLMFFGLNRTPPPPPPPMTPEQLARAQAEQHQTMMKELDRIREMAEQDAKAQQEQHQKYMDRASNIRVTLWEMWEKGPDQAVMDKADPELRAYLQGQAEAAGLALPPQPEQQPAATAA